MHWEGNDAVESLASPRFECLTEKPSERPCEKFVATELEAVKDLLETSGIVTPCINPLEPRR